jgi:hypothetical protein
MIFKEKLLRPLILLIIVVFISACTGTPSEGTTEIESETITEVVKTAPEKAVYKTEMVDYYVISRENYFMNDGTENGYKSFSYNDMGQLTGLENYKGSGDLLYKEKYILDTEGRVIRSELSDIDGLSSYILFKYSQGSEPIEEEYYNQKDVYLSGSTFEYNNQGLKTLWVSLDDNKSPVLKSEYLYDKGNLVKVVFLTPLNREDGSLDFTYEGDKIIREVSIGSNGKEERKTEYEYEGDKLIREKLFQLGRLSRTNEFEYDDKGNISLMTTYNRSGRLLNTTTYEYLVFQKEVQVLVK